MIPVVKFIKHLRFVRDPLLVLKIFSGYFRTLILKKNVLRSIELAITYDCQARCHKCYALHLNDPLKKTLTLAQIEDLIVQACRLGLIHVNITGGEPLLNPNLCKIIRICSSKHLIVSVVTNGMLLTQEIVLRMKDAGLNTIQISLDSALANTHDKLRGLPGCYERIMASLKWFKKNNINVCFSTVLSPESTSNSDEMKNLLKLAQRNGAFLLICDSAAVGGWAGQPDKMYSCKERDAILKELMRHKHARHHSMYNFRLKPGCPAGIEKLYVTAYGDVTPCDLIHDSFGNVLKEPLSSIHKRLSRDEHFQAKSSQCIRYLDQSRKPLAKA